MTSLRSKNKKRNRRRTCLKTIALQTLILFFYSTLQALNSEEEEDDNWEWDVNTNEVRLLDKCNHAGVGECDRKSEEVTPKLGGSSVDQE